MSEKIKANIKCLLAGVKNCQDKCLPDQRMACLIEADRKIYKYDPTKINEKKLQIIAEQDELNKIAIDSDHTN